MGVVGPSPNIPEGGGKKQPNLIGDTVHKVSSKIGKLRKGKNNNSSVNNANVQIQKGVNNRANINNTSLGGAVATTNNAGVMGAGAMALDQVQGECRASRDVAVVLNVYSVRSSTLIKSIRLSKIRD